MGLDPVAAETIDAANGSSANMGFEGRSGDRVIALAGNPNVGKSTLFNALTGMNQHTGNWAGKTVALAQGRHRFQERDYRFVDLPGTYSLLAHSQEEEIARDFILSGKAEAVVVVCDATCLERNLNLVLQILEMTPRVLVCVNLLDEAAKKGIRIDLAALEEQLGVPVVGTSARQSEGIAAMMKRLEALCDGAERLNPLRLRYPAVVEEELSALQPLLPVDVPQAQARWWGLRLLEDEEERGFSAAGVAPSLLSPQLLLRVREARARIRRHDDRVEIGELIVGQIVREAEAVARHALSPMDASAHRRDRALDRLFTSKRSGIPIMMALLAFVFWLTISGANLPSQWLADLLFWGEDRLSEIFRVLQAPAWLHDMLVRGVYRTVAWVVSVMLPPMAIFFPFFTLLEDFGYLPRVAFNLDHHFKKARTCGKQALTMCMGFGCNAVGVVGCRIIDSPRERLIAMLTNSFVPCNGRFPTLIAIISMFFVGTAGGAMETFIAIALLTGLIVLGVLLTFACSRLLSATVLRGEASSFVLELPPYRRPQIGKVILRSIFDRTLFVLGRAVAVAAPAGLIIWLLANLQLGDLSLLRQLASLLDPLAWLLGLDGVILLAFILGFPANEIVVPILIMIYMSNGSMIELSNLFELKALLLANGWTWLTALSTLLFCLVHWPCSTTLLSIRAESGSRRWAALGAVLPTAVGMGLCFLLASGVRLLGLVPL